MQIILKICTNYGCFFLWIWIRNFEWACAANYSESWLLFLLSSIDKKVWSLLLAYDRSQCLSSLWCERIEPFFVFLWGWEEGGIEIVTQKAQ